VERRSLRTLYTNCCTLDHGDGGDGGDSHVALQQKENTVEHTDSGVGSSSSVSVSMGGLSLNGATLLLRRIGLLSRVEGKNPLSTVFGYSIAYYSWVELDVESGQDSSVCYNIKSIGSAACDLDTHLTFTQVSSYIYIKCHVFNICIL